MVRWAGESGEPYVGYVLPAGVGLRPAALCRGADLHAVAACAVRPSALCRGADRADRRAVGWRHDEPAGRAAWAAAVARCVDDDPGGERGDLGGAVRSGALCGSWRRGAQSGRPDGVDGADGGLLFPRGGGGDSAADRGWGPSVFAADPAGPGEGQACGHDPVRQSFRPERHLFRHLALQPRDPVPPGGGGWVA